MVTRRGQALTELVLGLLTIALLTAVLAAFAIGIAESLETQNRARVKGQDWKIEDRINLGDLWQLF